MCISSNGSPYTHNHQEIWDEEMCMIYVLFHVVHLLIPLVQCDIATATLLLSAWVRYTGTSRSLSKGGAYSFIIIGQVGKKYSELPLLLFLIHSLGTVRHFATSIPDFSP